MEDYYLIQNNDNIETKLICSMLYSTDTYSLIHRDELDNIINLEYNFIPIGNIDFVDKAIRHTDRLYKGQIPIEIPKYLQTDEFLKRSYKIGTWKDIPKSGWWFIKDASELKSFSIYANMDFWFNEEYFDYKPTSDLDCSLSLPKDHTYIISSPYIIKSEYRAYIINQNLINISYYKGDPTILPDIELIKKAIKLINENEPFLKSYSLDLMVGPNGTAIIEIHDFSSLGLYCTTFERDTISDLRIAYKQGIEYLLYDNSIKY